MSDLGEIERNEEKLRKAMLAGDVDELDALLCPSLSFTNHDGIRIGKAEDLAAHRSGQLSIERMEPNDVLIRMFGETAVVLVTVELAGHFAGQGFSGRFAYTRVWAKVEGRWRVVAAHCSSAVTAT